MGGGNAYVLVIFPRQLLLDRDSECPEKYPGAKIFCRWRGQKWGALLTEEGSVYQVTLQFVTVTSLPHCICFKPWCTVYITHLHAVNFFPQYFVLYLHVYKLKTGSQGGLCSFSVSFSRIAYIKHRTGTGNVCLYIQFEHQKIKYINFYFTVFLDCLWPFRFLPVCM